MENKENLVTEEVAEKVEQTTEETPKLYTEEEFNAKVNDVAGKRVARREAKIRKEYDRKYGDLVDTLKAGTGKEDVDEINSALKGFYENKGVEIRKKPEFSAKDIEILARAEADEIIGAGYEEVVEEVDRLAEIGIANMSARDKVVFKKLAEYRQSEERAKELAKIGVPEEVYNSKEFKEYEGLFRSDIPIAKIYENYVKTLPKKEFKTTGSMKTTQSNDNGVQDYYTPEEARKFTKEQLDDNPAIFQAIVNSMPKWKK